MRRSCSFSTRLAQPVHACAEQQEHPQAHGDRDERALGLVHHHLVDDNLGADRHGESDQLDEERREQHVAPDALVPQQLGPEPAKAELRCGWRPILGGWLLRRLVPHEQHISSKLLLERSEQRSLRRLAPGDEVEQPLRVALYQQRGLRRFSGEKAQAGISAFRELAFARAEPERAQRLDQLVDGMWRGELPEQERGVKRNPVDLAQAADRPREICLGDIRPELDCHAIPLAGQRSATGCRRHPPGGLDRPDHPVACPLFAAASIKSALDDTRNAA
ncbi:MAG: hypothetical protein OEZ09_10220 [Betaproteobacteria bacterium]|nr:hypothetical protein [Betaproteobacteria bacterium]